MNTTTGMQLHELLQYDESNGTFYWRRNSGKGKAGSVAGTSNQKGYTVIRCQGRNYYAHRLAWFFVHGVWPSGEIDHLDRVKSNNRLANLRVATSSQNKHNTTRRADNTSGFKGVSWRPSQLKWNARICIEGRNRSLGMFATPEQASAAYQAAAEAAGLLIGRGVVR